MQGTVGEDPARLREEIGSLRCALEKEKERRLRAEEERNSLRSELEKRLEQASLAALHNLPHPGDLKKEVVEAARSREHVKLPEGLSQGAFVTMEAGPSALASIPVEKTVMTRRKMSMVEGELRPSPQSSVIVILRHSIRADDPQLNKDLPVDYIPPTPAWNCKSSLVFCRA